LKKYLDVSLGWGHGKPRVSGEEKMWGKERGGYGAVGGREREGKKLKDRGKTATSTGYTFKKVCLLAAGATGG